MASRARRSVTGSPPRRSARSNGPPTRPCATKRRGSSCTTRTRGSRSAARSASGSRSSRKAKAAASGSTTISSLDGVLQQHRHETALDAPDEEDAPRPRHEQREEVAEARGAVRVGEAARVLPARVEVQHVVAAEGEVLVGRVDEGPQRQAGGRAREARALGAAVERRREGGDGQAGERRAAEEPRAGQDARRAPRRGRGARRRRRGARRRAGATSTSRRGAVTATPPRSEPSDSTT